MMIHFLDVKKKVIGTYTDKMIISSNPRRELIDRFIQDSISLTLDLELLDIVTESKYIMISDGEKFRVNALYQKDQDFTRDNNTIDIDAKSESLDRAEEVEIYWDGTVSILDLINTESARIGFNIELKTGMSEEDITEGVGELIGKVFKLSEVIEAILQVIGGFAEFDTILKEDYVDKTVLRIGENLGKQYNDALIYGVNISSFERVRREEGIITAVEYTGKETELADGSVDILNLKREGSIPSTYTLPRTNREVRLTVYTDEDGVDRYLLEDTDSTRRHGRYTSASDRNADPIIASFSNTDVPTKEDLIELSIRELDGKNIPQTQYNITASVSGLDVGDDLGIQVPHLGINITLPVLSVEYGLRGGDVCDIMVGDHMPTELDRRFESIPTAQEQKDENDSGGRGEVINTPVLPQDIVYATAHLVLYSSVRWYVTTTEPIKPREHDYYLDFEYMVRDTYKNPKLELGISSTIHGIELKDTIREHWSEAFGIKFAEVDLEGNSGSVEVRLNDFYNFTNLAEVIEESGLDNNIIGNILNSNYKGTMINVGTYIIPLLTVENSAGVRETLPYIDSNKYPPVTEKGLQFMTGYIKDFTITENRRK